MSTKNEKLSDTLKNIYIPWHNLRKLNHQAAAIMANVLDCNVDRDFGKHRDDRNLVIMYNSSKNVIHSAFYSTKMLKDMAYEEVKDIYQLKKLVGNKAYSQKAPSLLVDNKEYIIMSEEDKILSEIHKVKIKTNEKFYN